MSPLDVQCPTCGETAGRECLNDVYDDDGRLVVCKAHQPHPARISAAQQPRSQVEVAFARFADELAEEAQVMLDIADIARRIAKGQP